ncbi:uncharacterized protein LOC126332184 [Schistocerca gregaria]|uniref:uncharacterized protein LOC126332184 n=1 Tax=Schistocerca gregaria TaxID=7010 RepID=UPI00211F309C|nr:uncharacterized protein LOC126332184 [Schistocerca gregaria]
MKALGNFLVVVVVLAEISMFLTETDNNSLKFVAGLNKLLSNSDKIIHDYCDDERISCNNDSQISSVTLYNIEPSAFPIGITVIIDTLNELMITWANLKGNIPNEIYNLKKLQYLDLRENKINGSLKSNIKNIDELNYLNLYESNLSESIPMTYIH